MNNKNIEIVNKNRVTEKQIEDAVLDFTYGVIEIIDNLGMEDRLEKKPIYLDGGKSGILVSKKRDILTLQRINNEEDEATYPRYKFDLGADELVYFDTKENRHQEPCFEVYVLIQMWDHSFSHRIV
jgi:hypothetical protein